MSKTSKYFPTQFVIKDSNHINIDSLFESLSSTSLEVSDEAKRNMADLRRIISEHGFNSSVIEFSHFVYQDEKSFNSIMYGDSNLIGHYKIELLKNTDVSHSGVGVGPIVPSLGLYSEPFWLNAIDEMESGEYVEKAEAVDIMSVAYLEKSSFSLDCEGQSSNPEIVHQFISNFHSRIVEPFVGKLADDSLRHLLIIPFRRLEEGVTTSGEANFQGGALICLGSVDEKLGAELFQFYLFQLRSRLEKIAAGFLFRQEKKHLKEIADQQRQMDLVLFRRGAIHESRTFARGVEDIVGRITPHIIDESALRSCESVLDSIKVFRKTVDVLTDTSIPFQNEIISQSDLKNALDASKAFLWHTFKNSENYRNNLRTLMFQDLAATEAFLSQFPEPYKDSENLSKKIEGVFGICVIGIRNLLENAINGCGDRYNERRERIIPSSIRDFGVDAYIDAEGDLIIANTAVFPQSTYEKSWGRTTFKNEPVGIDIEYNPATAFFRAGQPIPKKAQSKDTELSLKGAKFAQVLLEAVRLTIFMEPVRDESGSYSGTRMIVRRKLQSDA